MTGQVGIKADKRAIFSAGEQSNFLIRARAILTLSWPELAYKLGVVPRTLNDWKREKYSLPLTILGVLCKLTGLKRPQDIEVRPPFWSVKKAGAVAGKLVYQKYGAIGGDPAKRKQKWLEWWHKFGKFNPNKYFVPKEIFLPKRSADLAEFVGIMMGDGGITQKQTTITLNSNNDKQYSLHVINLIKKLFKIKPSIYFKKNVLSIVISRKKLVKFCKSIGLCIGGKVKQQFDIPAWVKNKKCFAVACIRGLMDTDGCIFNECHKINKKLYCYPRLSFVSHSEPLRNSVYKLLKRFGFSAKVRNRRSVQLENRKDILRYFGFIRTNNPKHKTRFDSFLGGVG